MWFASLLLIIGFIILIKSADLLVDGASILAARFSVSQIVIGLTIVAFGTSAPELMVNLLAAFQDRGDISLGNVIGSNIINILLILGIASLIYPLRTQRNTVWREIPFAFLASLVLAVIANDQLLGKSPDFISRGDGIILLFFFLIFVIYNFAISKVEIQDSPEIKDYGTVKMILFIVFGILGLFIGGKLVVDNAVKIARMLALSDKMIGLTIIAIGTSLPELFTSALAAYKHKSDIAIGNIIGSNIFNVFLILGLTSTIRPIGFNQVMNVDLLVLVTASALLFFTMFTGKRRLLDRWEAILFLLIYICYMIFLINRQ